MVLFYLFINRNLLFADLLIRGFWCRNVLQASPDSTNAVDALVTCIIVVFSPLI